MCTELIGWWTNERRWDEVRREPGEPLHSVRIGVILFNKICKIELKKEKCERAYSRIEFRIILFPSCQMPFKSAKYQPRSSAGMCRNNGSRHTYRRSIVVDQSERARTSHHRKSKFYWNRAVQLILQKSDRLRSFDIICGWLNEAIKRFELSGLPFRTI